MVIAEASVETDRSSRYLVQLCRAWPAEVSWQLADALLGYFLTHADVPRLRRQPG